MMDVSRLYPEDHTSMTWARMAFPVAPSTTHEPRTTQHRMGCLVFRGGKRAFMLSEDRKLTRLGKRPTLGNHRRTKPLGPPQSPRMPGYRMSGPACVSTPTASIPRRGTQLAPRSKSHPLRSTKPEAQSTKHEALITQPYDS